MTPETALRTAGCQAQAGRDNASRTDEASAWQPGDGRQVRLVPGPAPRRSRHPGSTGPPGRAGSRQLIMTSGHDTGPASPGGEKNAKMPGPAATDESPGLPAEW